MFIKYGLLLIFLLSSGMGGIKGSSLWMAIYARAT